MTKQSQPPGFLRRWSRLKTRARKSDAPTAAAPGHTELPTETDEEFDPLALRQLFHRQEFNHRDGMNEYDGEYTGFTSLGTLVTREMQRALALTEQTEETEADNAADPAAADEKLT